MMEVLGATGIVMLLTAVVGTFIMGVVDSSKDAAGKSSYYFRTNSIQF